MVFALVGPLGARPADAAPSTSSSADLAVTVQPHSEAVPISGYGREGVKFQTTLVNNGPSDAKNVVLTATISGTELNNLGWWSQLPCIRSAATITCTGAALSPSSTINLNISFTIFVGIGGAGSVTLSATSATPDQDTLNNTATGTIQFHCVGPSPCIPKW
jgi:hypothetical protein